MALSAKVFRLGEYIPFDVIYDKLSKYRVSEDLNGIVIERFFRDLSYSGNILKAEYVYDEPMEIDVGGEIKLLPRRRYALTAFTEFEGNIYLIILEKKFRANKIALALSEILFIRRDMVLEAYTTHEILKGLHEANPESTRVIYFDNVNIPNINKLALYGMSLADTTLYSRYLEHGYIWYVVFEHKETGYVVGVTRNMIIAMFSNITSDEFINFIIDHLIPLIR
ncbi:TPA: hypothetical protein EYP83_04050 [Candidatus Geothermarchaeota archaeon]|nr:hypothetical protein [Candidatus Geothermarchaeota archaeon]HIQ13783.1 hypothetical protein [Thermoprotei archaeon]